MKITMPDGSPAEVSVDEYAQLVSLGIVAAAPKPQNQAELLRAVLAEVKPPVEQSNEWAKVHLNDIDFSTRTINLLRRENITTFGDLAARSASELLSLQGWRQETIVEVAAKLAHAGLKLKAEIPTNGSVMGDQDWKEEQVYRVVPPVAYVTQAQMLVVDLLRHHPEGLKTKEIAEKLRWDHTKATRVTTHVERTLLGYARPIIERVPHHYKYRLTAFGKAAAFKIDSQPSRKREMIRNSTEE